MMLAIGRLGKCLATAKPTASIGSGPGQRAAAMTGCRLDEIEGLLKTEVDPVGMALRLGRQQDRQKHPASGSAVIAVLKTAMAKSKSKYVFPAVTTDAKHHTGSDPMAEEGLCEGGAGNHQPRPAALLQLNG